MRASMKPTMRKSALMMMPWLIIWITAPLMPVGGEGKDAERDEAQVADARVGHDALDIAFRQRHQRAVEDAEHGQRGKHESVLLHLAREERQREPDEPVGAELADDPGEEHQHRRRAGLVEVGQPGVEGNDRDLDGKRERETDERQLLGREGRDVDERYDLGGAPR